MTASYKDMRQQQQRQEQQQHFHHHHYHQKSSEVIIRSHHHHHHKSSSSSEVIIINRSHHQKSSSSSDNKNNNIITRSHHQKSSSSDNNNNTTTTRQHGTRQMTRHSALALYCVCIPPRRVAHTCPHSTPSAGVLRAARATLADGGAPSRSTGPPRPQGRPWCTAARANAGGRRADPGHAPRS